MSRATSCNSCTKSHFETMTYSGLRSQINAAVTDLRIKLNEVTQKGFAEVAGWQESKVSRLNLEDVATVLVILDKVPVNIAERLVEQTLIRIIGEQERMTPERKRRSHPVVPFATALNENAQQQLALL